MIALIAQFLCVLGVGMFAGYAFAKVEKKPEAKGSHDGILARFLQAITAAYRQVAAGISQVPRLRSC
jgi:hypothetical protein